MKIEAIVERNYHRFCHLDGSEYIASEFALLTLLNLIKSFKITSVLEIGIGIGSIADTILKYSESEQRAINYKGTEANPFCRKVLVENIENFSKVNLYPDLSDISPEEKFQLIIIDGQDKKLNQIRSYCDQRAIIFIEGDRTPQRDLILKIFPTALQVNVVSLQKNKPYAHGACMPTHYVGGGQVIFIKPTGKMKLYWFFHKLRTQCIWRIRLLYKT